MAQRKFETPHGEVTASVWAVDDGFLYSVYFPIGSEKYPEGKEIGRIGYSLKTEETAWQYCQDTVDGYNEQLKPIVLEVLTYRYCHNSRFVSGRMVDGPANVLCHVGEGGESVDERTFLGIIRDLHRHGKSYIVNTVTEQRSPLEVVGDWGGAKFDDEAEQPEPEFDVRSW